MYRLTGLPTGGPPQYHLPADAVGCGCSSYRARLKSLDNCACAGRRRVQRHGWPSLRTTSPRAEATGTFPIPFMFHARVQAQEYALPQPRSPSTSSEPRATLALPQPPAELTSSAPRPFPASRRWRTRTRAPLDVIGSRAPPLKISVSATGVLPISALRLVHRRPLEISAPPPRPRSARPRSACIAAAAPRPIQPSISSGIKLRLRPTPAPDAVACRNWAAPRTRHSHPPASRSPADHTAGGLRRPPSTSSRFPIRRRGAGLVSFPPWTT